MKDELAKNICRYRKELGFTQEELAKRLGITFQAVSTEDEFGIPFLNTTKIHVESVIRYCLTGN